MDKRRLQDLVGVVVMGDAVTHLLRGKLHWRLWMGEPGTLYGRMARYLADHPLTGSLVSAGEFALGYWLVGRAEKPAAEPA